MNELNRFYFIFGIAASAFATVGVAFNTLAEVLVAVIVFGMVFVAT